MPTSTNERVERDALGERRIPENAYYGVQTARAVENFPITGWRPYESLVTATIQIKKAAARVNASLGALSPEIAGAIECACDEILGGAFRDQFIVDPFQAGAGTSHNMNANEVLANRAIEILGGKKGDYTRVHPNDHVNMSQSTNDVFPAAMRLAALDRVGPLIKTLGGLADSLQRKAGEFDEVVKSGRTHLQDAVPVTLGQEFSGYEAAVRKNIKRIQTAADGCREIGLGGTAVGTGLNAPAGFRSRIVRELEVLTAGSLVPASNYFEAMQSVAPVVELSGALRTLATDIIRIANDLRLLSSGPYTGLAEITLPGVQPGSSIMPGKVNPVMAEMIDMVCFQVIGNDLTVTMAAQAGQLELNVMMPVIAFDLLMSMTILTNGLRVFADKCIDGITADRERSREYAERSAALVTALSPRIGYARAAEIAKKAVASGKTIRQIIAEESLMSAEEAAEVLDTTKMTEYGGDSTE